LEEKKYITVLDGYTLNPGDVSWEPLKALGNVTIYDRTLIDQIVTHLQEVEQ
jgi:glycerate dehydrogenase